MTIDIDRYKELKAKVDKCQREADRAEGALQQLMGRLKDKFDCETIEQGEELAEKLSREADEAEDLFDMALVVFEAKHQSVLKGDENE